jgi:hypothetical protein
VYDKKLPATGTGSDPCPFTSPVRRSSTPR